MTRRRAPAQIAPPRSPYAIKRSRLEATNRKVIDYIGSTTKVTLTTDHLKTINKDGITCLWNGKVHNLVDTDSSSSSDDECYSIKFAWNFDWTELKAQGVESLSGYLIVKSEDRQDFPMQKIDIDWVDGKETVSITLSAYQNFVFASFEYHLTARHVEKVSYDEMFAASDKTDAILIIEGKKLHVNKVFLSFHSDFFSALFSSNFMEGKMAEIPIQDVSYEDFGLLMSTIYPNTVFANDKTAEKLLALADRFLMPAVTRQVEHHLLNHSDMENDKLIWLADAYSMPKLLNAAISVLACVSDVKDLQKSPEFEKLSKDTKCFLFDRVMQLI